MATSCPETLVLILDPTGNGALHLNGANSLDVGAGKIQVNSGNACGISLIGSAVMSAVQTSVVGGACYVPGSIIGLVQESADVVPDPLANVLPADADWGAFKSSLPAQPGTTGTGAITASGTYDPGYYPGGISASVDAAIQLNPGSYMLGTEVTLGGNANVTGSNVTLFLDKDVDLDISGSGAGMNLTPPGASDPFYGITMFTHRQTSPSTKFKLGGGGPFLVEGIVYVPSGELVMGGTPGKEIGAILAWRTSTAGTTGFTITANGVPSTEPPTWCNLGSGLAGSAGFPSLAGTGSLVSGSSGSLMLTSAASLVPSILFMSLTNTPTPFKGGVLSAVPVLFELGLGTSGSGDWMLPWTAWPSGLPAGLEILSAPKTQRRVLSIRVEPS